MDEAAILAAQRDAYRRNFLRHGDTPKGTFQNDRTTQNIRFATLIREIAPYFEPGTTIHDVGSGLCDFYDFLIASGLDGTVDYSGTEIVEEMNAQARKKHPGLILHNRNFLSDDVTETYDFCILSGTLNLLGGIGEEEWRKLCCALIAKMFQSSRKGIAFNFLTSYRTFSDPTLCYFDPKEMFDFATTQLSRFVVANAGTPLYEVTFTVFRKEFLAGVFSGPAVEKYFR